MVLFLGRDELNTMLTQKKHHEFHGTWAKAWFHPIVTCPLKMSYLRHFEGHTVPTAKEHVIKRVHDRRFLLSLAKVPYVHWRVSELSETNSAWTSHSFPVVYPWWTLPELIFVETDPYSIWAKLARYTIYIRKRSSHVIILETISQPYKVNISWPWETDFW